MNQRLHAFVVMDYVPIGQINFDPAYQRPVDVTRVARMAKAFSSGAVKAVSLSRREDQSLWCFDGMHTVQVLQKLGCTHVPALIVAGDQKREAEWFSAINGGGTRKATVRDVHRAQVVADDELACRVKNSLDKFGLVVASGGAKAGTTSAIGSIRIWAKTDPIRLDRVMSAIHSLWQHDDHAWTQIVMRGMWDCASDGAFESIVAALKKKRVTPRRVLDSASAMQLATGATGGGSGFAKRAILSLAGIKT